MKKQTTDFILDLVKYFYKKVLSTNIYQPEEMNFLAEFYKYCPTICYQALAQVTDNINLDLQEKIQKTIERAARKKD